MQHFGSGDSCNSMNFFVMATRPGSNLRIFVALPTTRLKLHTSKVVQKKDFLMATRPKFRHKLTVCLTPA